MNVLMIFKLWIYGMLSFILCNDDSMVKSTKSKHTNNWAVLVSASRFWFNYRHLSNAIAIYRTVKRLGIPDSNIILMLADDIACNPRNSFPGNVFKSTDNMDLYEDNIEVDYKGYDVTVENFVRLLTNRLPENTPKSKRLLSDKDSNILIYLTGHGGENFLKFQDHEEITAQEIADSFKQMYQKSRYNEILYIVDTCQANSMYSKINSTNIISMGSSQVGENSLSHEHHAHLGVSVIEQFTHFTLEFMKNIEQDSRATLNDYINYIKSMVGPAGLKSTPGFVTDNTERNFNEILVMDFFGSVQKAKLTDIDDIKATVELSPLNNTQSIMNTIEEELGTLDKVKGISKINSFTEWFKSTFGVDLYDFSFNSPSNLNMMTVLEVNKLESDTIVIALLIILPLLLLLF